MLAQDSVLFGNYTFRVLENAEFFPLFHQYRPRLFQTMLEFDVRQAMSLEEQTATARLRERMGALFRLNIGLYHHQEFIGWSFGWQESAEKYYMVSTGILPRHQGKGIYSALLPRILETLQREEFQIITSQHVATNNQILVPKLKAGFVITGIEVSDVFGVLVDLSYFFNPTAPLISCHQSLNALRSSGASHNRKEPEGCYRFAALQMMCTPFHRLK